MPHQFLEIGDDLVALRRPVVELGKIAPHRLPLGIVRVGGKGRHHLAVRVAGEPLRSPRRQLAVLGGVVDHEVHDDPQPVALGGGGEIAQQRIVAFAALPRKRGFSR